VRLSASERAILAAMRHGSLLRSHRDMDGQKLFRLHSAEGPLERVDAEDVHHLRQLGLIDSNKKFPVATFWLTDKARQ